jgi:hypothetical protein
MSSLRDALTPLISTSMQTLLVNPVGASMRTLHEDDLPSQSCQVSEKGEKRVVSPMDLPDRIINQVCLELQSRKTGSPMMFQHQLKYYVCFKSACANISSRTPPSLGHSALLGHKKVSFMKGCFCSNQCKTFDEILKGPNGHVWAQAVAMRLSAAQTLIVNKDAFMWFPIKAPIYRTPQQQRGKQRKVERRRSLPTTTKTKGKVRLNLDIAKIDLQKVTVANPKVVETEGENTSNTHSSGNIELGPNSSRSSLFPLLLP